MRRILIIGLGTAVALATAAVAIAVTTAAGVSTTTAMFTAAKTEANTRSCTADGKTFEITNGHYTGTAAFAAPNAALGGALTIHARTTYDTVAKLGYVQGSFRIKDGDSRVNGKFWGTLNNGSLVGFLTGKARGNHAVVFGNISATFVPATGFASGQLGSGSTGDRIAVIAGPCKGDKPDKPASPVTVKGVLTLAATAATVTPKEGAATTCTFTAGSSLVSGFSNGNKVEMKCDAALVLQALKLKK